MAQRCCCAAGGDGPVEVGDEVTLRVRSKGPMMFHGSEAEMQDRVGANV